jgi:hypothetical protein
VGASGSPYAAFQRALKSRNVTLALAEAREMPRLNLYDALRLVVLIGEEKPELYERAAVRWAGRYLLERPGVTLAEAQVLFNALAANEPGTRGLLVELATGARR